MFGNASSERVGVLAGLAVLGMIALAGCSAASTAGTGTPGAPSATSAAGAATGAAAATPADASAPAATPAAPPASGGGAADFCAAWAEYQDARNADTTEETGAGFRAAATDMRATAPAEITAAAGLLADVLDEFGQSMLAGGAQPETLGQGQSPERQKGVQEFGRLDHHELPLSSRCRRMTRHVARSLQSRPRRSARSR